MILVDGSNLINRLFYVAIAESFKEFKTRIEKDPSARPTHDELFDLQCIFLHLTISELLTYQQKYSNAYGKILVAFDSGNVWRRLIYPKYKSNRRDEVQEKSAFDQYVYTLLPMVNVGLKAILDHTLFYYVENIKYNDSGVEADDIIAVMVKYIKEKHLICSTDQDYIQLLNDSVRQYNPFHKKMLDTPSKKTIQMWKDINLISGQSKDGIPGITEYCQLDDAFIAWCKTKHDLDIDHSMIDKIETEHMDLMEEYRLEMAEEDVKAILAGTRKKRRKLDAYKKPRMGESGALKFLAEFDKNIKINPRYEKNYKRNQELLLFEYIPSYIEDTIKSSVDMTSKTFLDTIALQAVLLKYKLYKLYDESSRF
jgi:5'-3' exonuclease